MINMKKGDRVNMTKTSPSTKYWYLGLGWRRDPLTPVDLDVYALILDENGRCTHESNIIYFNNIGRKAALPAPKVFPEKMPIAEKIAIAKRYIDAGDPAILCGDSRDGAAQGDDEVMLACPNNLVLPDRTIALFVNIYQDPDEAPHGLTFGCIDDLYVLAKDMETGDVKLRYDLSSDYSACTGILVNKINRRPDGDVEFVAMGQPFAGQINEVYAKFAA